MSIIKTIKYIDVTDLSEEAHDVYRELVGQMGLNNGEMYSWEVSATEDDSSGGGYLTMEQCKVIDDALKVHGFEDGDEILLSFSW